LLLREERIIITDHNVDRLVVLLVFRITLLVVVNLHLVFMLLQLLVLSLGLQVGSRFLVKVVLLGLFVVEDVLQILFEVLCLEVIEGVIGAKGGSWPTAADCLHRQLI